MDRDKTGQERDVKQTDWDRKIEKKQTWMDRKDTLRLKGRKQTKIDGGKENSLR